MAQVQIIALRLLSGPAHSGNPSVADHLVCCAADFKQPRMLKLICASLERVARPRIWARGRFGVRCWNAEAASSTSPGPFVKTHIEGSSRPELFLLTDGRQDFHVSSHSLHHTLSLLQSPKPVQPEGQEFTCAWRLGDVLLT